MRRLKTKTGCRTCLIRKKKCDEGRPKCGQCLRLGLVCVPRDHSASASSGYVSLTNMRANSPDIQLPISHGYPPFRNALEQRLTQASPTVFHPLLCPTADPKFQNFKLFGRFCTQNLLVREAIVAFAAYGQGPSDGNPYKLALSSYQSCISRLKQIGTYNHTNPNDRDLVLTAIMFLGLLEVRPLFPMLLELSFLHPRQGLRTGDPGYCIAHFEASRKLLTAIAIHSMPIKDPTRLYLYRMIAECTIYNMATMSAFDHNICHVAEDCGAELSVLFAADDLSCSPFLCGNRRMYFIMYKINRLLRRVPTNRKRAARRPSEDKEIQDAWLNLSRLEEHSQTLYEQFSVDLATKSLYMAINQITICALKIHLTKISSPWAATSDMAIRPDLLQCIAILEKQDVRIPANPALRWPLTIVACAADTDDEFTFIAIKMEEIAKIIDPANGQKMRQAVNVIGKVRWDLKFKTQSILKSGTIVSSTMDLLLDPGEMNETSPSVLERYHVTATFTGESDTILMAGQNEAPEP